MLTHCPPCYGPGCDACVRVARFEKGNAMPTYPTEQIFAVQDAYKAFHAEELHTIAMSRAWDELVAKTQRLRTLLREIPISEYDLSLPYEVRQSLSVTATLTR